MTLQIAGYGTLSASLVEQDLLQLTADHGPELSPSGVLWLNANPTTANGQMIKQLTVSSALITISLVEQMPTAGRPDWVPYQEAEPAWGRILAESVIPGPGGVEISYMSVYPAQEGIEAQPFEVEVVAGSDVVRQAEPQEIILLHMLSHASIAMGQGVDSTFSRWEAEALDRENEYRDSRSLAQRVGQTVFVKEPPPVDPPPAEQEQEPEEAPTFNLGGCGCFIATAAYGSPFEPEVASLRHFRDDVLLRTRTGAAFFERFYRQYYRFSPAIAAAIERDSELREASRWAATPIVRYLEIAQMFPDAPLEGVPEPWRNFLTDIRDKLEAWTTVLGLPEDFGGLSPAAAAAELAMALRYILRREDSRQRYLEHLTALGKIPIACSAHEYEACARALTNAGRPERELSRLLTIVQKEVTS